MNQEQEQIDIQLIRGGVSEYDKTPLGKNHEVILFKFLLKGGKFSVV
jgi:hypothetical protein